MSTFVAFHSYMTVHSDAAPIPIWIATSCPANIKHSNLQFPRVCFEAVPRIQRLIPKERDSEKWTNDESSELHSSYLEFCMVKVVCNGLESTLIWSIFCWGSMLQDPPRMLCAQTIVCSVCRTTPNSICTPLPSSISWSTPEREVMWAM